LSQALEQTNSIWSSARAGSASVGLANLLCSALVAQGLTLKEAQPRVYMFDINGLLEDTTQFSSGLAGHEVGRISYCKSAGTLIK
jgi:malic enzyme